MLKKIIGAIMVVLICLFISDLHAQQREEPDVYEPSAGNFSGIGARAMGMGGAYIAVANDATALVYNPAALTRVKRIELSGGFTHQRLRNRTGYFMVTTPDFNDGFLQSNTRFSSGAVVVPVPTYRGSLVFALGLNRVASFDKAVKYNNPRRHDEVTILESGGLYLWSLGGAIDLSPEVSVGGALNFWFGEYDFSLRADSTCYDEGISSWSYHWDDHIEDKYSGWNLKFGVRVQPNRFLVLGGTIETPVTYTVEEDWLFLTDTVFYRPDPYQVSWPPEPGISEYRFTLPFSLGFGVAFNFNNLILAGDLNYTDWTQMEYKRLNVEAEANRVIKDTYREVLRWHLGGEYLVPQIGTRFRLGYYQNPLPYESKWIKSDRHYLTGGVGFLIDRVMTVDLALVHGFWEFNNLSTDLASQYTTNQIFLTTAYHF
ncbi:MAG: OmpP1/FadL family transporter [Candidatus Zixiibacteriota bacterium]